jgi:hypothetical protein
MRFRKTDVTKAKMLITRSYFRVRQRAEMVSERIPRAGSRASLQKQKGTATSPLPALPSKSDVCA